MTDREQIRELYKRYADTISLTDVCRQREELYRDINDLKKVRPPVLIFEVPWGELSSDPELKTENETYRWLESDLKVKMYQWKYFQNDMTYEPYFPVGVHILNSGTGVGTQCKQVLDPKTGTYAMSHEFIDQFPDESSIEKIKIPEISLDKEGTDRDIANWTELLGDIVPIRKTGAVFGYSTWDTLSYLHGPDNCLYDLVDRPEFMHALVDRYTQVALHTVEMYEKLNVFETEFYYIHCCPALVRGNRHKDLDTEKITAKDTWCRLAAQIFGSVSPAMVDEFDLQYAKKYSERFGRVYYGCCEPLDTKMDILEKAFPNLARVGVTPWANVDIMAEKINTKYVLSFKANPAFVSAPTFDPEPVEKEITNLCEAAIRNNCTFEIVLKDISTIANNRNNLTEWSKTVNKVLDRYF